MKRPVRSADGLYHIKGKTYKVVRGSRAQVWNGTAYKTEGGLLRSALMKSHGRIVSAKKHKTAKKELRLQKYGYFAQKGKFGYVKKSASRKLRKSLRKKRGGGLSSLSPLELAPSVAPSVAPLKSEI
jgi:hypothetical protein